MATPERALPGILNISALPREAPVLPAPKPEPKQAPVSPEPGKVPTRKSLIQRLAGNLVVRIAFAGLALAGTGYGISRIASGNNTQPPPAEEAIAKENIIQLTRSSFTPVSPEQEQELWTKTDVFNSENHTITTGFPLKQEDIDKNPDITITQKFNAILPPFIDAKKLEQNGVKNLEIMTQLSNGTEYSIYYDDTRFDASLITLYISGITLTEGSQSFIPAYTSCRLILRNKETGESVLEQTIGGLYAQLLVPNKPFPSNYGPVYEDGTPIKSGDSILRLTTNLQDWDGKTGQVLPGEEGQFVTRSFYQQKEPRAPIPLTRAFLLNSDGSIASQE